MRNSAALLAVSFAVSACGEGSPQPTALEQLQGGQRPYTIWKLAPASVDDVSVALGDCINAVHESEDFASSSKNLRAAGWRPRPYPDDLLKFVGEAAQYFKEGENRSAVDSQGDPVLNPANWPEVFERADSPALLALSKEGDGKFCSVLAQSPEEDFEQISRAVASLDQDFAPRIETPHGFRWQNGEVSITEDYGDGTGGRWEFLPPVFAPIKDNTAPPGTPAANLTVFHCKGTC
ncbi:hypothetical protein [Erythrobacter sp. R86502]|uniref:hypothetical protein n=1 Tax=Erythrobacter sp. R86502 TaxID=3093846 RepID=UPI0036D3FFD9